MASRLSGEIILKKYIFKLLITGNNYQVGNEKKKIYFCQLNGPIVQWIERRFPKP